MVETLAGPPPITAVVADGRATPPCPDVAHDAPCVERLPCAPLDAGADSRSLLRWAQVAAAGGSARGGAEVAADITGASCAGRGTLALSTSPSREDDVPLHDEPPPSDGADDAAGEGEDGGERGADRPVERSAHDVDEPTPPGPPRRAHDLSLIHI